MTTTTATNPLPTTDKELCRLAGVRYPLGWDEWGSSQKDAYEDQRARVIRKGIPVNAWISRFETAESAWWFLYHERIEQETDYERETGTCLVCGKSPNTNHGVFGDCDDDGETAATIGRLARKGTGDILVTVVPGSNIPMAYVVHEHDGRWSASFGPY